MSSPPGGYPPPPYGPYGQPPPPGNYGAGPGYGAAPGYGAGPAYGQGYGANPYGPSAPPFGAAPHGYGAHPAMGQSASGTAIAALVLAILSWVVGGCLLSLPAFFIARSERASIMQGTAPVAGKGMVDAAYWVSLVNLILYLVVFIGVGLMFMLGMLGAAASTW